MASFSRPLHSDEGFWRHRRILELDFGAGQAATEERACRLLPTRPGTARPGRRTAPVGLAGCVLLTFLQRGAANRPRYTVYGTYLPRSNAVPHPDGCPGIPVCPDGARGPRHDLSAGIRIPDQLLTDPSGGIRAGGVFFSPLRSPGRRRAPETNPTQSTGSRLRCFRSIIRRLRRTESRQSHFQSTSPCGNCRE